MSLASQIARIFLIVHGILNIAQGLYSITRPHTWISLAGSSFTGTPPEAVQAIGLGALGIGWYQFIFALQDNQPLFAATVPLRIVYAAVIAKWGGNERAVGYEIVVWGLAVVAAWPEVVGGRKRGGGS